MVKIHKARTAFITGPEEPKLHWSGQSSSARADLDF